MLFLRNTAGFCATLLTLCAASPLDPRQAPAALPFASPLNTLDLIHLPGGQSAAHAKTNGVAPLTSLQAGWGHFGVEVNVDGQDVVLVIE